MRTMARKWAASMAAKRKAVNNHPAALPAKTDLRRKVIDTIGEEASVLDLFAGSGVIFRSVWVGARKYAGCDLEWHPNQDRLAYSCDNVRLLRHLDLGQFNIFDLDAYGSPWEQATIIAARRKCMPGEKVGVVLTDGSAMRARLGRVEGCLAAMAGMAVGAAGAHRDWISVTGRAVRNMADRMGADVENFWCADGGAKRTMLYSAAIFAGR